MTASDSVQSAAPDELEVRAARLGVPAAGAKDRQAALPGRLQAFHRALLDAFRSEAGAPNLAVVGQLAAELQLGPQVALAALAATDQVHPDLVPGRVRVADPFSAAPTAHRVKLAEGPTVDAMCAWTPGRCSDGPPRRADPLGRPISGQPITMEVDDQGWGWQPATTVVLAVAEARRSFGGLLHRRTRPRPGRAPTEQQRSTTCNTTR